ncbi:MAG: hypothetical protein GX322_10655 [Firmicutes bacterium]|nr:hypothetical protein [Bacillota bacterium]
MDLALCPRCFVPLNKEQCPVCRAFFIHSCPHCGNTLIFEQVNISGTVIVRCGVCNNEMDFELISVQTDDFGLS